MKLFLTFNLFFFFISAYGNELSQQFKEMMDAYNRPDNILGRPGSDYIERRFQALPTSASVARIWSGIDTWPFNYNGLASVRHGQYSPIQKYDLLFNSGSSATQWEMTNHGTANGTLHPEAWAGHCNGMAAAAVLLPEPVRSVNYRGIVFQADEVKALLAEVFYSAPVSFVGSRCNSELVTADQFGRSFQNECRDINPGAFHIALTNMLGRKRIPVIMDIDPKAPVWNTPIQSYQVISANRVSFAQAQSLVDGGVGYGGMYYGNSYTFNAVARDFLDVSLRVVYLYNNFSYKTYRYILELGSSGEIIGGEWVGSSKTDHPDFLWYPKGHGSGNPYVSFENVYDIARMSF